MWMWMGEGVKIHHNFAPICSFLGVNGIRGAKYLPHIFGTLGVNMG
jgi:hypothetical protein